MPDTTFRSYSTPNGQVYEIDNVPVSKEEFETRAAASKQAIQGRAVANRGEIQSQRASMFDDVDPEAAEAMKRLRSMRKKHGGSAKQSKSKISTHQKSKKASSW